MLGSPALEEIIRAECLPLRDCMLTITDTNGEAAFLYFKEAELIEANYAALWGKEALGQITTWELAEHTVAPLPLGIKRSLWDQLEFLLNPGLTPTASGRIPVMPAYSARRTAATPYDRFKNIEGLLLIVQVAQSKETVVFNATREGTSVNDFAWLKDFGQRVKSVGDTLGFGTSEKWTIETDRYHVVALRQEEAYTVLVRRKDAALDDLEQVVEAIVNPR